MFLATSVRITGAATIKCRHFLGANCTVGTLLVDQGGAPLASLRIASVAAGEKFSPKFPIATEGANPIAQQVHSRIHCSGATDATIFYSL